MDMNDWEREARRVEVLRIMLLSGAIALLASGAGCPGAGISGEQPQRPEHGGSAANPGASALQAERVTGRAAGDPARGAAEPLPPDGPMVQDRKTDSPSMVSDSPGSPTYARVELPDGQVLDPWTGRGEWMGMKVEVLTIGYDADLSFHTAVYGHHAEVEEEEEIVIGEYRATLAHVRRMPPAADEGGKPVHEIWLSVTEPDGNRPDAGFAHCLIVHAGEDREAAGKAAKAALDLAGAFRLVPWNEGAERTDR
jgi:hypothetical protein